jgi:hypothetical protein
MQRRYISRSERARRLVAAENKAEVKSLVDAALARTDLRPDVSQVSNAIRLLCAVFVLNGHSLNIHRGWVTQFQAAFAAQGLKVPNGRVLRTYRSRLQENAHAFANTPLVDRDLLAMVEGRYLR